MEASEGRACDDAGRWNLSSIFLREETLEETKGAMQSFVRLLLVYFSSTAKVWGVSSFGGGFFGESAEEGPLIALEAAR